MIKLMGWLWAHLLGPLFASDFMSNFERDSMNDLKKLGVNTYGRYVDGIFATVYSLEQAESFVALLNSRHVNIKFE